jgi:hypothetical protein
MGRLLCLPGERCGAVDRLGIDVALETVEQEVLPIGTEHLGHPRAAPAFPHAALDHAAGRRHRPSQCEVPDVGVVIQHRVVFVLAVEIFEAEAVYDRHRLLPDRTWLVVC